MTFFDGDNTVCYVFAAKGLTKQFTAAKECTICKVAGKLNHNGQHVYKAQVHFLPLNGVRCLATRNTRHSPAEDFFNRSFVHTP
jgi:UDP-N-acetylglucosamine enolpyruvyl transferase